MTLLGFLVAFAVTALAVVGKQLVERIDERLDKRDEIRRTAAHNQLPGSRIRRERETRQA